MRIWHPGIDFGPGIVGGDPTLSGAPWAAGQAGCFGRESKECLHHREGDQVSVHFGLKCQVG